MKRLAFLIATGIAVFAIACSSDGDNDDDSAPEPTHRPQSAATATSGRSPESHGHNSTAVSQPDDRTHDRTNGRPADAAGRDSATGNRGAANAGAAADLRTSAD